MMKIEVKQLLDNNEMLSHIFLECIPRGKLLKIQMEYVGEIDWRKESVKIPVEMKIGGVSINPKQFFDNWQNQMQRMILDEATKLVSDKLGSAKIRDMQEKLSGYEQILEYWENEINWEVQNPFLDKDLNANKTIDKS